MLCYRPAALGVGDRLWSSWKAWAERSNERPGKRKSFAAAMKNHGFLASKSQHVRGHVGIDLAAVADDDRADFR